MGMKVTTEDRQRNMCMLEDKNDDVNKADK